MKTEEKVARRYAQALAELCSPAEAERIREDLFSFAEVWKANSELREALINPAIGLTERKAILVEISDLLGGPTQRVANLLCLLLENGRISAIVTVAEAFSKIVDKLKKLLALEIESAHEVSAAEKEGFVTKLQKDFGTLASVAWTVNSEVIGGVRVKNGDTLYDASIRGALDRVKLSLINS